MIANLTPFRGPSADVGTVYEVGFMRALGRPVYGYATTAEPFTQRTLDFAAAHGGVTTDVDGFRRDADGLLIEQFGLFDNLMIEAGILASGGVLDCRGNPRGTALDRPRGLRTLRERCRGGVHSTGWRLIASVARGATGPSAASIPNSPGSEPRGNSRVTCPIFRPGRASALP